MTVNQIKDLWDQAYKLGAVHVNITGGEPLMRRDIVDVVKALKPKRTLVSIVTTGIFLTEEKARELKKAGLGNLYMSFDGVSPKTNPKNHWEAPICIESCRKAGLGVVLVPTVIKTVNDHELGDIFHFARDNIDTVHTDNSNFETDP